MNKDLLQQADKVNNLTDYTDQKEVKKVVTEAKEALTNSTDSNIYGKMALQNALIKYT